MAGKKRRSARLNAYALELLRLRAMRGFTLALREAEKDGVTHIEVLSPNSYTFFAFRQVHGVWQRRMWVQDMQGVFHRSPKRVVLTALPGDCDRLATLLREETNIANYRHDEDAVLIRTFRGPI